MGACNVADLSFPLPKLLFCGGAVFGTEQRGIDLALIKDEPPFDREIETVIQNKRLKPFRLSRAMPRM